MKTLINKVSNALSGAVLFAAAVAMAGLGFAVVASLAVFAFFAIGIALLTAPVVAVLTQDEELIDDAEVAA